MENVKIEIIKEKEMQQTFNMIEKTVRTCFVNYYPPKFIEELLNGNVSLEKIKKRATWTHFYVAKINKKIVGCGAIGPYWDSLTESSLFTIFVDPDFQKRGIGRLIVKTLENDEFFKRAKRIEVPASIYALPFYIKMGYKHKNGELIFEHGDFKLEKFNNF